MPYLEKDDCELVQEHGVLLRHYGEAQRRCSAQARCQSREIERLQGQLIIERAKVIVRDSLLAWEREDRDELLDTIADLSGSDAGASPQDILPAHIHGLAQTEASVLRAPHADPGWLEHSLRCADLVICQTGCVSHGAFWRVADHCKRTGKACVLVEQPGALNIVRLHPSGQTERLAPDPLCEKDAQ